MRSVLAVLLALLSASVLHAEIRIPPASPSASKRFIVGFRLGASSSQRERALKSLGATVIDRVDELGAVIAEVPEEKVGLFSDGPEALAEFSIDQAEEDVYVNWLEAGPAPSPAPQSAVEAIRLSPTSFKKSEAAGSLPPGVDSSEVPWGIARVNAPAAWAKSKGEDVRVAVVDTGIDASHPDLAANVAGSYNALDSGAPVVDDNGHGTHVAGTIAAALDGKGVVGVAPKARLYAVKVLGADGAANLSSIVKGLIWCARNDMQVANMSLGAPVGSIFMRLAVKYANYRGVTVVAAAGNNGKSVEYPGGYPEAIAVSASDSSDKIAKFSGRGAKVEFIAPGVSVKSSIPGGKYDWYSGTSMATPHVTGLAALAISRGAQGSDGVRKALKAAAKPLAGLKPEEQGSGMIDAALLVK